MVDTAGPLATVMYNSLERPASLPRTPIAALEDAKDANIADSGTIGAILTGERTFRADPYSVTTRSRDPAIATFQYGHLDSATYGSTFSRLTDGSLRAWARGDRLRLCIV